MLTRLGTKGMNEGVSDAEADDRRIHPSIHWWLAPNVNDILRELDNIAKRAKARRLVHRKGNRPIPIANEIKTVYRTPPSQSLPTNWYRKDWYDDLDMYQKHDVKASHPEELPTIVSHYVF
jgi:hypothetical protein